MEFMLKRSDKPLDKLVEAMAECLNSEKLAIKRMRESWRAAYRTIVKKGKWPKHVGRKAKTTIS